MVGHASRPFVIIAKGTYGDALAALHYQRALAIFAGRTLFSDGSDIKIARFTVEMIGSTS